MTPLYMMLVGLAIAALAFSLPVIIRGWQKSRSKRGPAFLEEGRQL
jgi:hypothetical protein